MMKKSQSNSQDRIQQLFEQLLQLQMEQSDAQNQVHASTIKRYSEKTRRLEAISASAELIELLMGWLFEARDKISSETPEDQNSRTRKLLSNFCRILPAQFEPEEKERIIAGLNDLNRGKNPAIFQPSESLDGRRKNSLENEDAQKMAVLWVHYHHGKIGGMKKTAIGRVAEETKIPDSTVKKWEQNWNNDLSVHQLPEYKTTLLEDAYNAGCLASKSKMASARKGDIESLPAHIVQMIRAETRKGELAHMAARRMYKKLTKQGNRLSDIAPVLAANNRKKK